MYVQACIGKYGKQDTYPAAPARFRTSVPIASDILKPGNADEELAWIEFGMSNSLTLVGMAGIRIRLHVHWFLIVALLVWSLASHRAMDTGGFTSGQGIILAGLPALLFFIALLGHELAHTLPALRFRIPVKGMTVFLFSGTAQLGRSPRNLRTA